MVDAVRRFRFGAFLVQMNPLAVFSSFGKLPDAIPCHDKPIGSCDLAPDEIFQIVQMIDG